MSARDDCVCAKCHRDYDLADGCEPSKYCNACVHDVVEEREAQITAVTAKLAVALEVVEAADDLRGPHVSGLSLIHAREEYDAKRAELAKLETP